MSGSGSFLRSVHCCAIEAWNALLFEMKQLAWVGDRVPVAFFAYPDKPQLYALEQLRGATRLAR